MQAELEKPLHEYFDVVVGTSTGAILAAAVSAGIPPEQYVNLYFKYARTIFPPWWKRIPNRITRSFTQGLSAPKYSESGINKTLKATFGDLKLSDLHTTTLFTTYDVGHRKATVLKTTNPTHLSIPVWEAVRASVAAPTFFPAHLLAIGTSHTAFVDGGVVANNPVVCGIAEAASRLGHSPQDCLVISLGTGKPEGPISNHDARTWGALQWAIPIVSVMMDGDEEASAYIARALVPAGQYYRIQTNVRSEMDDSSRKNLEAMVNRARSDNHTIVTLFEALEKIQD